jgi:uncharacterized RDD family membrane protein YckC
MVERKNPPVAQVNSSADGGPGFSPVDNYLKVSTPENIAFYYQIAGPFQRVISFLLDFVFSQAAYWIIFLVTVFVLGIVLTPFGLFAGVLGSFVMFLGFIGAFFVQWFYGAFMETFYNGRTWGKMICRQRVLNADGSAINGSQALLRNFFRLVDTGPMFPLPLDFGGGDQFFIPIPTAIFGLVVMCINRDFRRIGDLVAGTIVVKEEVKRSGKVVRFSDARVPLLAELLPSSFVVDREMALALATYVERRPFLGPSRLDEIARRLSPLLIEKMNLASDTNPDLLLCSLYYKTFHSESTGQENDSQRKRSSPGIPIEIPIANSDLMSLNQRN